MAAFLQGSNIVPKDVKLVVLPSSGGPPSKETISKYLMNQCPTKFRFRTRKTETDALSYFDSSVQPPKKTFCDFDLIYLSNPVPPQYRESLIGEAEGLPVTPLICLLVNKVTDLLEQYDAASDKIDFIRRSLKKILRHIRALLPTSTRSLHIPLDKAFRFEAAECLERVSIIFPELSNALAPLIRGCRTTHSNTFVRLTYPNGSSINVGHLIQKLDFAATRRREILSDSLTINTSLSSQSNVRASGGDLEHATRLKQGSKLSPVAAPFVPPTPKSKPKTEKTVADYRSEVVCLVAKKVVKILQEAGVECALFGSLACFLYGNKRPPNDLDILIFPPSGRLMTAEYLKQVVANGDPDHFTLDWGKNTAAAHPYRVLYYSVDSGLAPANTFHKDKCKVDILLPGIMHLPHLSKSEIKWKNDLPVIPFSLLLLQKLQGWDDHRRLPEPYQCEKSITDASDVHALLKLEHVVPLRFAKPWGDRALFSEEFISLSIRRVKEFTELFPSCKDDWLRLGFELSSEA
ncbi:hypothetical protein CPC08DRAFT_770826 [Agrocybe pediades]|nr:hypothetical protein CPC08DRAFT_770826 [Agrocybe pediades]